MKSTAFTLLTTSLILLGACGGDDPQPAPPKEPKQADKPTPQDEPKLPAQRDRPVEPKKPAVPDKPAVPVKTAAPKKPASPAKTGGVILLKIDLPKPHFAGTPKNLRVRNLEKARPGRRPLLKVPAGVKLLSRGKPVTSSEADPWGDLEWITDGNKKGVDDTYVELGFGKQWVQIDLEQTAELHAIVVWHYHYEGRVYHDVVVQVSTEPDFISPTTLFNNDDDNSSGLGVGKDKAYLDNFEGKLIPVKGLKARYVRLYSKGNTANDENHYVEVEVFGKPAKK